MLNLNFYYYASIIFLFILSTIVILLLRQIRCLNSHIDDLKKENKNVLTEISEKQKKPLGNLLSPRTKSMILSIKKNGEILEVNNAFLDLLGYSKKQLIGKNIYGTLMPIPSTKEPLETNIIHRIFKNPKFYTEHETEMITKEGNKVWISWTNRLGKDKRGNVTELHSVGFDITTRKKMEEELQFIASKDPQTGVLNRLSLMDAGTRELKRSIRYKHAFSALALRLLSSDKELPSQKIEELLKQVVSFCRKTIRDTDYLGRVGEAEFVLLLPETEGKKVPFLQKRLEEQISFYNANNPPCPILVSFGISSYTKKMRSIDELISLAISNIQKRKMR